MWIGLVIRSLILTAVGFSEKQNVLGTFLQSLFKLKGIQRRKYTHGYLVNVWFYRRPKRDYMKKWPDVSYIERRLRNDWEVRGNKISDLSLFLFNDKMS